METWTDFYMEEGKVSVLNLTVHINKALLANELTFEENNVISIAAEKASRNVLFKDNLIVVNEDFNRILGFDIHFIAKLDGEHYSAQLVYSADDTCGFHDVFSFAIFTYVFFLRIYNVLFPLCINFTTKRKLCQYIF